MELVGARPMAQIGGPIAQGLCHAAPSKTMMAINQNWQWGATMRYGAPSLLNGLLVAVCFIGGNAVALEPGQSPPIRLYSIGDSLTRAANANLPGDNLNNSWVNGYYGFWEWLFGLPNVNSHNQRITAQFGSSGRRNWIAAQDGARMSDMVAQAAPVALLGVTYA